jgi:hypothetical protein
MLDEYDNETDDSSVGSIKFIKGNVPSSNTPLIREESALSSNVNTNKQNKLIDDIGDIFGISSGPTQKTASNDLGFLGGLDLTSGGNNIMGLDTNFVNQGSSSNNNVSSNKANPNDLLSSLGAVR